MSQTPHDRMRQAQCEMDRALAKRQLARKLWDEAEEELIEARYKMEVAERAQKLWLRSKI